MSVEEALKAVKDGLEVYLDDYPELTYPIELHQIVIRTLEKQVPKKPNRGWCPTCGSDIEYELDYGGELRCEYCSGCGQAIDWSDVEE